MVDILKEMQDWKELAEYTKKKIANKQKKEIKTDGTNCFICKNFIQYAENNCDKGFVCHSCKTHINQVIYDFQLETK